MKKASFATPLALYFFHNGTVCAALSPPSFPSFFGFPSNLQTDNVAKKKADLLEAVSYTNNGKTASPSTQTRVLRLVREIETEEPPSETLLSNPEEAKALDGVWYLQYTSPSVVGDEENFPDAWKPSFASEGDTKIETRSFDAKGSVSAQGINVDVSNRVVKQIFDIDQGLFANEVELDFGMVRVAGTFRQSENVPTRAIAAFREADISLNIGITLRLGFLFAFLAAVRGTYDSGWLETTYLGEDMRIGRGNKGTMFVLTREADAVKP